MKKLANIATYLLIFCLASNISYSQISKPGLEKIYERSREYELINALPLESGGFILFGNTTAGDKGGYDIFLHKIDKNLETIDESFFGSPSDEYIFDAFQLDGGNILFYGKKETIVNNNPRWNIFYNSYNLSNKKGFYREFVSFENDSIAQSKQLENGDILFIGNKEDWGDRDQNIWLSCINSKGNLRWQVNIGERYIDEIGLDVIQDGDSYYILAEKREKEKITPLLIKTDLTGNVQWQKEIQDMQGYQLQRFFLNAENSFVVFGAENNFSNNNLAAFQIDKSARLIVKSSLGSFDSNSGLSFALREGSVFVLSNSDNKGLVYEYKIKENKVSSANITSKPKVEFKKLFVGDEEFFIAGNIPLRNEPKIYLQKNSLSFNNSTEGTKESEKLQVRAESGLGQMEVLEPANNMGIARLHNASNINLKLRVNTDKSISKVLANEKEMTALGNQIYSLELKLNEGYNDFEVKALTNEGKAIVKYVSIENILGDNTLAPLSKGKSYALIITVNHYLDPAIVGLDNPENDGKSLANTLQSLYTFEKENTYFLKDPTREDIITKFDQLVKELDKEDNLLIFYAGHGYFDKNTNIGYWLPADAKKSNTANWLSNSTIKDFISAIPSKHTLLIADACFSGGIFKTRKAFSDNIASVDKLYELPSRKAMTSGALTEVPDKSVFIQYLVKRLNENDKKYISSEELFSSMRSAVLNNSSNVPQYGEIQGSGDEGGDFIFIRRD